MNSSKSHTPKLKVVSALLLATFSLSFAQLSAKDPFSEIFTFGDSLSDTGNLYILSGGTIPPDPPYYQGRFSNGPIWTEQLADMLGMELPPENQFALAGSQTGYDNFEIPLPLGFRTQIDGYLGSLGLQEVDPNALHTIWIGANDFFAWLRDAPGADPVAVIATGVTNTASAVG